MQKTPKKGKVNPKTKEILMLLAAGAFIPATILFPGLPLIIKPFLDYKKELDFQKWQQFNQSRLKQSLRRLKDQKVVEIVPYIGHDILKITEKGHKKIIQIKLESLKLTKKWDGKWRLIIYDIPKHQKKERNYFRQMLKNLECLQLQKSVYLTPHPCEEEIEYLRQLFNVSNEVKILKVANLENEKPYRDYFGI